MFPGFSAADFDSYEPKKWKSNVYTRERQEVKQRLLVLSKEVAPAVTGADGSPLFIESSVEHPALWNHKMVDSQRVYFSRTEAARKELDGIIDRQKPISSLLDDPTPQRNHVFLAITLSHEALEVSLKLHPDASVDRQNLERKVEDHFQCEELLYLLKGLPAGFDIGITPEKRPIAGPSGKLTMEELRALVDQLHKLGQQGQQPHPVNPLAALSSLQREQAPVAHLFYVGISLPKAEALALPREAQIEWVRTHLTQLLPIYRFVAWSRDNDFVSMRQVLDKEKVVKRQRGLAKNDTVRIIRGMFAGKNGVVQEVDAKGALKVLVGKMAVKLDAADVER